MTFSDKIKGAKELIKKGIEEYPRIIVGSSFGKDSMVLLHLVREVDKNIPVFSVMAETEFKETLDFARGIACDWGLDYREYFFKQDSGKCCGVPKVEKTKEALGDYDAWISGVRRTEGITRANFNFVETKSGLTKINPLLEFTELDIWRYIALNNLPVNPKYKEGFRSLGCSLCSFPEEDENDSERAGRWKGTPDACGECGIHTNPLR